MPAGQTESAGFVVSRRAAIASLVAASAEMACSASQGDASRGVTIEDHGGGTAIADNTGALKRALASLASSGGGTVRFDSGTYRFASASLGSGGIELPARVTVEGRGKDATRLAVTGASECYFFLNEHGASDHHIVGLSVRGNGVADRSGPGGFYYCSVLAGTASAGVRNCTLENVRMENFRGDCWVRFLCTHPRHSIAACGLGPGCEARSERGNSRDPTLIQVTSFIVEFRADGGVIDNCFVNGLSADLDWVKGGIAAFGGVHGLTITAPVLRNAFQGYRLPDKGSYAIVVYDSSAIATDTTIESPVILNPFSCGIYLAGSKRTRIVSPRISGQSDRVDTTLPKAAIALNGANNVRISDPQFSGNRVDIDIAGISAAEYDANMDILVTGGSGRDATECGVKVKPSAFTDRCGGIRFLNYRSITSRPGASGMAWHIPTDRLIRGNHAGVVGFEWRGGECTGGSGAYDIDLNRASNDPQLSGDIVFADLRTAGEDVLASIKGVGCAGGPILLSNVAFDGTAQCHVHIEDCPDLRLENVRFNRAASGGVHTNLRRSRVTLGQVSSAVNERIQ